MSGVEIDFSFDDSFNTAILLVEGKVMLNNKHEVQQDQFVLFQNSGTDIHVKATQKTTLLVMSGEPIDEPVYPYGPFLMNTEEEIRQAYDDYNAGAFGYLED